MSKTAFFFCLSLIGASTGALAEGNLASQPIDLPELSSDGQEEFAWMSPELFRNAWVNQIVVNDLEVKSYGVYSLEFDAEGTFEMTFVPIRPGRYDFWVDGYEGRGMLGAFVVN
jgi:hypothetical protein